MSSKEENKESCLDVRLSINICKNYNVKVQKNVERHRGMVVESNAYFFPGISRRLVLAS